MTSRNQYHHHYCQRTIRNESLLSVCLCDRPQLPSFSEHPLWPAAPATLPNSSNIDSGAYDVIVDSSILCDSSPLPGNRTRKAASVGDLNDRAELLSVCIRRDLYTVDNMIRAIDSKLSEFKVYLDLIEKQQVSKRLNESYKENNIQLDQIVMKCDQMLRRLNHIENEIKAIAEEKDCRTLNVESKTVTPKGLRRLGSIFVKRSSSSKSISQGSKQSKVIPNESKLVQPKVVENTKQNREDRNLGMASNQKSQINSNASNPAPHQLPNGQQPKAQAVNNTPTGDSLDPYKARLRDTKVMHALRVYLAFLHNQPTSSVCFDGMTNTSARMFLALEGFPIDSSEQLKEIYLKLHETNGISRECALADLTTYKSYIATERIQRLQRARETTDKFYGRNCSKPK